MSCHDFCTILWNDVRKQVQVRVQVYRVGKEVDGHVLKVEDRIVGREV
jgi:hypothetical protein